MGLFSADDRDFAFDAVNKSSVEVCFVVGFGGVVSAMGVSAFRVLHFRSSRIATLSVELHGFTSQVKERDNEV